MQKAVTFGAWLWIIGAVLSIGFASPRGEFTPLLSNPAENHPESRSDIGFSEEPGVPSEADSFTDPSVPPVETGTSVRLPVPVISRRQALMRMYECLKAADRSYEGRLAEFAELEDSLVLVEHNYFREVWKLPYTESVPMGVDAESGTLLHLRCPSPGYEAPRTVSHSQAEGIARGFVSTAYPEFHSRPFRSEVPLNEGNMWRISFSEDHGADVGQFRNWISVEVDAASGAIVTYLATYVRVETDPILCSADKAKSRALDYLFPADEARPAPFSTIDIQATVEPVSRSRAKAHWNVVFSWLSPDGDENRFYARGANVDCSTGEIIVPPAGCEKMD